VLGFASQAREQIEQRTTVTTRDSVLGHAPPGRGRAAKRALGGLTGRGRSLRQHHRQLPARRLQTDPRPGSAADSIDRLPGGGGGACPIISASVSNDLSLANFAFEHYEIVQNSAKPRVAKRNQSARSRDRHYLGRTPSAGPGGAILVYARTA
jgi:hypothetical protein